MIDQVLKDEYLKVYRAFADTKDQIKEMNGGLTDLIKEFAKKLEVKPAILNKTFSYRYKKNETGEDELGDIIQIIEEVENS